MMNATMASAAGRIKKMKSATKPRPKRTIDVPTKISSGNIANARTIRVKTAKNCLINAFLLISHDYR